MKIFLDTDASPITNEIIQIAKDFNLELIIVKNYLTNIESDYATIVSVDISPDAADLYIANNISKGDLAITADRALSALLLGKGAYVFDFFGYQITMDNILYLLDARHESIKLRKKGIYSKNKPRKKSNNIEFREAITKFLSTYLKGENMITLFVSAVCPDCPEAIEAFKNSDLNYKIVDINENIPNLKLFLKYRDNHPFFDSVKANNKVGIPSIMIGDGETFYLYNSGMDLSKL